MEDSIYLKFNQGLRANSGYWYKCIQLLGTGGNAATFLVVCTQGPNKGILFALKIFRKLSEPKRRKRFLSESQFLKQCNHPAIIRTFDDGLYSVRIEDVTYEYPFIVAEYLPYTLADVLRHRDTSVVQKVSFTLQLISALKYLWDNKPQIVHRDIKPQNIFVKGKSCVLGDFGLMKFLDSHVEDDRNVFRESMSGKIPFLYRTPDLIAYAKGEADINTKSDIFQLGLVLVELFTGWNPVIKPQECLDPFLMNPIGVIPCFASGGIASLLKRMLVVDPDLRENVTAFMDPWSGIFWEVAKSYNELEGKAL